MTEIKWIKLSTSMFDDKKIKLIRRLPSGEKVLLVWIQLLIEAGKCNLTGRIMLDEQVPLTDEMFAIVYDLEVQEVRHAFKTLEQFGMIEFDESQVLRISNWEKHQNIEGMEQAKLLRQARNKRYQEKKKQLAIGTDDKTSYKTVDKTQVDVLDIDIDIEKDNSKKKYLDTVFLTDKEYERLVKDFGKSLVEDTIERLDEWQTNNPKKQKTDHNKTIRVWLKGKKLTRPVVTEYKSMSIGD